MNQEEKQSIMDLILNEKVFILKGGPFRASSGLKVPFYADFRRLASNPKALKKVSEIFSKKIIENKINIIGGIETTGIPFATAISIETGKNMIWFRKKIREHGLKSVISGIKPKKEDKIAVIDDSVGGGDSLNTTIKNLEKEGYKINIFLSIMEGDLMNSLEKRKKHLKEKEIDYFFICTWKEWVDYILSKEQMSKKMAKYFYQFIENPLSFDENKLNQYKKDLNEDKIWIGKKN